MKCLQQYKLSKNKSALNIKQTIKQEKSFLNNETIDAMNSTSKICFSNLKYALMNKKVLFPLKNSRNKAMSCRNIHDKIPINQLPQKPQITRRTYNDFFLKCDDIYPCFAQTDGFINPYSENDNRKISPINRMPKQILINEYTRHILSIQLKRKKQLLEDQKNNSNPYNQYNDNHQNIFLSALDDINPKSQTLYSNHWTLKPRYYEDLTDKNYQIHMINLNHPVKKSLEPKNCPNIKKFIQAKPWKTAELTNLKVEKQTSTNNNKKIRKLKFLYKQRMQSSPVVRLRNQVKYNNRFEINETNTIASNMTRRHIKSVSTSNNSMHYEYNSGPKLIFTNLKQEKKIRITSESSCVSNSHIRKAIKENIMKQRRISIIKMHANND